ncbi:MAG: selenocysteine-specific translation elongation factor [Armatimonadota bacterium]
MPDRHVVFGTAGHVDHGKSALVRALTGTDPDRLAEEKAREMTIDLGFAFLSLPELPEPIAIVDVPGHEMFVRNMVAGATGIDAALFVVAADEGVMPQTAEHLRVLQALRIAAGLIALTKADRVGGEQLAAAESEMRAQAAGSFLENAPMVPVSALTGAGLPELRERLADIARGLPMKPCDGPFRLPIDRSFTIRGAGTVVTGTVISGRLSAGDQVVLLPSGRGLRVRALQVHGEAAAEIVAGQRAAVNLAGIEKEEIERGDVLVAAGAFAPSLMLDARVELARDVDYRIGQRTRLRLHHGTAEVMARAVLLDGDELLPGESALAQLRLESALVAAPGDRFVLRSYSPMQVVGGGVIADAHPPKRRRASGGGVEGREQSSPEAAVLRLLNEAGASGITEGDLQVRCGLSGHELQASLKRLAELDEALSGKRQRWFSAAAIAGAAEALLRVVTDEHRNRPHWLYAPLNRVLAGASVSPERSDAYRLALGALIASGRVIAAGERLRLAEHQPQWSASAAALRDSLLALLRKSGLATPSLPELAQACRASEAECQDILEALVDSALVLSPGSGIYLDAGVAASCRQQVVRFLNERGQMSIADARELLGASRKYLLPFLEQLDRAGITQRRGDSRVLGSRAPFAGSRPT